MLNANLRRHELRQRVNGWLDEIIECADTNHVPVQQTAQRCVQVRSLKSTVQNGIDSEFLNRLVRALRYERRGRGKDPNAMQGAQIIDKLSGQTLGGDVISGLHSDSKATVSGAVFDASQYRDVTTCRKINLQCFGASLTTVVLLQTPSQSVRFNPDNRILSGVIAGVAAKKLDADKAFLHNGIGFLQPHEISKELLQTFGGPECLALAYAFRERLKVHLHEQPSVQQAQGNIRRTARSLYASPESALRAALSRWINPL